MDETLNKSNILDRTETVIIGGGIIGVCTAYFLAKKGRDVVLVDRGVIGAGTSTHCNGSIVCGSEKFSMYNCVSNELYVQLISELGEDFHYRREGSLKIIGTQKNFKKYSDLIERQKEYNPQARIISREDLKQLEPNLALENVVAAVEYPSDADLNPYLAVKNIVRGAEKRGVRVYRSNEVRAIDRDGKKNRYIIHTSKGKVITEKVVNAGGSWSPQIGEMVGINIPVVPLRGQVVVTENIYPIVSKKVNEAESKKCTIDYGGHLIDLNITFVYEPTPHGNCLIGRSEEFVGFDNRTTLPVISKLCRRAAKFIPKLKKLNIIRTYSGLRPFCADGLPIISEVVGMPGFYIATGHGGNGISMGPVTGVLLSEMVTGQSQRLPWDIFSLDRFQQT